jgi:hypothetical protein
MFIAIRVTPSADCEPFCAQDLSRTSERILRVHIWVYPKREGGEPDHGCEQVESFPSVLHGMPVGDPHW